jgi:hypothetical protein
MYCNWTAIAYWSSACRMKSMSLFNYFTDDNASKSNLRILIPDGPANMTDNSVFQIQPEVDAVRPAPNSIRVCWTVRVSWAHGHLLGRVLQQSGGRRRRLLVRSSRPLFSLVGFQCFSRNILVASIQKKKKNIFLLIFIDLGQSVIRILEQR